MSSCGFSAASHVTHVLLWVLSSLLCSRLSRLLSFPDPLFFLIESLFSVPPVFLPLVLSKLLRIWLHLLQPFVCLLVKIDLACSRQVCCSLGEISKEPVRPPSELVCTRGRKTGGTLKRLSMRKKERIRKAKE